MNEHAVFSLTRVLACGLALVLSLPSWRRARRAYEVAQSDPALGAVALAHARERSIFLLIYVALFVSAVLSATSPNDNTADGMLAGTAMALLVYEIAEWDKRRHLDGQRATFGPFYSRLSVLDALWMSIPVALVDLHTGTILAANQAFERLFGYRMLGELRGQSVELLIPVEDVDVHRANRLALARGELSRVDQPVRGVRKNGAHFSLSVILKAVMVEDVRAALVVCEDLSAAPRRRGDDA